MRARIVLALSLCTASATACMPWVTPPAARVVAPGDFELGLGVTALVAPDQPKQIVPVPQAWLRTGLVQRVDLGLFYAAPLTGVLDARWLAFDRDGLLITAGIGGGVHAFPDVGDLGENFVLPLGTAQLSVERERPERSVYGFARAWVPAYLASEPYAAVAWGQFGAGVEYRARRVEHGPQLGAVVPSTGVANAVLVASWTVRRRRREVASIRSKAKRRKAFRVSEPGLTPPRRAGIIPVSKRRGVEQSGSSPGS